MEQYLKIDISKRNKIVLLFLFLFLFFFWLYFMYSNAYRDIGCDFQYYSLASSAFINGNNPYQTSSYFPYVYPLFFCVLISPLVILPAWLQHLLWYIITISALFSIMIVMYRFYYKEISNKQLFVLLIPFFLLIRVFHNNLVNGQVTIFILFLCVLFLNEYLHSRRFTAALFLSAAICIKLTPLILLIYILFRRDFLMIGLVIIISLVLSIVVPYIIAGTNVFEYYSFYLNTFLKDNLDANFHFSPTEYAFGFSVMSFTRYFFPAIPKLLSVIAAGVLTVSPIVIMQLITKKSNIHKETQIFSLYILAMLLISPLSETSHLIYLYPALLIITIAVFQDLRKNLKVGIFILIFVLFPLILGRFYISANIIEIIVLYGSLLWLILRKSRLMKAESFEISPSF